jgi:hypothetical protein
MRAVLSHIAVTIATITSSKPGFSVSVNSVVAWKSSVSWITAVN